MARQFFLYTPFLHSGDIDDQALQHGLIENYRAMAGSEAHDPTIFKKVHLAGPPQGECVKMEDYVFWVARKVNCLLTVARDKALREMREEQHGKSIPSKT